MEAGALTSVLIHFSTIFAQSVKNLVPYANNIFYAVVVIDFGWALSLMLLDPERQPLVSTAIRKAVRYGIFYWLIQNYSGVVTGLLKTFTTVGLAAGGNLLEPSVLTDPSYVIDLGFATWHPILKSIGLVNMLASHRPIMALLTYIVAVIGYFIIAMQIFITYLEFYIVAGLAVYFLPLGCWDRTTFLSEKAISAIIAVSVRIMVVSFVLSASLPALIDLQASSGSWIEGADNTQATKYMFTVLAIAFLSWMVPSMAVGLFSGTPSLSGGQAIAGGMMMAAAVTQAISGGFGALQGALQAGSAAGSGAATLAGLANGAGASHGGSAAAGLANTARLANLGAASDSGGGGFSSVGSGAGDAGLTVSGSDLNPAEVAAGVSGGSGSGSAESGGSSTPPIEPVKASDLNPAEIAAGVSGSITRNGGTGGA